MPNVSHENHLIFMRMTVQVTYIFMPIVSLKDSFCHSGNRKLGIGLFIHELLREPLSFLRYKPINRPFSKLGWFVAHFRPCDRQTDRQLYFTRVAQSAARLVSLGALTLGVMILLRIYH